MQLEALHDGFPKLLVKVQQGDTATLREIVTHAATDRGAAHDLLNAMAGASLAHVQQVLIAPAFALIAALMTPDTRKDQGEAAKAPMGEAAKAPMGKPIAWADLYADLYKIATGWLGWAPDIAWNATLPEILHAFDGHIDQLKAVHGDGNADTYTNPAMTADQRQANIEAGLDPDFDREGLRALKARHT
tara:strand:- start:136045 stop:136611 length:567 start_codon:yes stop_codon:yes gene_type:complete